MRTQLLSGAGTRLSSVFLCCLCVFALPAVAKAVDPSFGGVVCSVQSVTTLGITSWEIKGTSSAITLPANSTVTVNISFQKKANGAALWSEIASVDQSVGTAMGRASIDTGFIGFTAAPAKGDQYRASASGSWKNPGPPAAEKVLVTVSSVSIIPVP